MVEATLGNARFFRRRYLESPHGSRVGFQTRLSIKRDAAPIARDVVIDFERQPGHPLKWKAEGRRLDIPTHLADAPYGP
jgi:hypothetical protein